MKPMKKMIVLISLLSLAWLVQAKADDPLLETSVAWYHLGESPLGAVSADGLLLGVTNDALIVAGYDSPTLGNSTQNIWAATRNAGNDQNGDDSITPDERSLDWHATDQVLPGSRSYGASANHKLGLIAIADSHSESEPAHVVLIQWHKDSRQVQWLRLPELSAVTAGSGAAVMGNMLYLVLPNGEMHGLDLSRIQTDLVGKPVATGDEAVIIDERNSQGAPVSPWQRLPSLPQEALLGGRNSRKVVVVQNDGRFDRLFVISGGGDSTGSADASSMAPADEQHRPGTSWAYYPNKTDPGKAWVRRADVTDNGTPTSVYSASGVPVGQTYLLVVGKSGLTGERTVLSYNAVTNAWVRYDDRSEDYNGSNSKASHGAAITRTVHWGDDLVLIRNSSLAGDEPAELWAVNVKVPPAHFGWINMTVVVLYLLAMVLVGVYFAHRNKDTNDFFRGGQHVPWWAAACSIYATLLSSLTYLALPALVYRTDWVLYGGVVTTPILMFFIAYVIMPAYRKLGITSVYEYLSDRYNMTVRLFASTLYILFQIGRMGIVLALTALALAAITPLDAWESVLVMGVLSLIYSTMGGVEAVIWTDTIQTIMLMFAVLLCLALVFSNIDGGFSEYVRVGVMDNKFKIVNLDFGPGSIHTLAIWVIILGSFGQNTSNYTADQAIVQRYMTAKDTKSAVKTVWMNAAIMAPSLFLFYLLGTALYVYYQTHPAKMDPGLHTDQILPMFIGSELPLGLAGLMVAGIFAAAQSTISTSMNSSASIVVTDFMRPFNACSSEKSYLKAARWITVVSGVLGTIAGLVFINPDIRSLLVEYFKIIGMFMGVLGGLFLLGLLTKRTNSWGAMIGIFCSVGVVMLVWRHDLAHGFIFATIGISSCVIIGYVASLLLPCANHEIEGLTIYTMRKEE